MELFKRYKYNLPKVPHTVRSTFNMLIEDITLDEREKLRKAVHEVRLESKERSNKSNFDCRGALLIAEVCDMLLDRYEEFPPKKRALITAAVRYYAVADDPLDDDMFASGLWDDMAVINYVLERLGIEGHYFNTH